jgi:hypothetical protein
MEAVQSKPKRGRPVEPILSQESQSELLGLFQTLTARQRKQLENEVLVILRRAELRSVRKGDVTQRKRVAS